jgi:hypothetical protein
MEKGGCVQIAPGCHLKMFSWTSQRDMEDISGNFYYREKDGKLKNKGV